MNNTNFGKYDSVALLKNYNKALENPNFQNLVNKFDLPPNEMMKYTSSLEETVEELTHCSNCKGLLFCKNRQAGFVYYPEQNNHRLCFNYIACKYKKKALKEEELTCTFYEMPEAIRRASMKNITLDDANRVGAIKWLKNFYDTYDKNPNQKGLYLHGSFGSGKTYLISAMLNELAKKNVDITVVYYPELLRSLKEAFETDFASRISKLKRVSILFLDDMGAESLTSWARDEILGTILQYRMDAELPTFFTSNLTIDELEAHLATTKNGVEKVKARRIIERIKQLTDNIELISKNRRN